ncbi:sigma factor sigX-regulated lipoprotein SrpA [Leptospira barantonii]|uniref:Lipoprotein n=1 Tax=Leptospira barantonii TaxID=2023184 RepID=A0ABX4NPD5_9LEPT|nr:hypothetical protein [Leptospira barantonii]PJZ57477.1 hypothetical protein CH367_08985 [Leptospira barantonii]
MKQNIDQSRGKLLRIVSFAMAVLFAITSCKKDTKDNTMELLLAASVLNGPNGTATFNFSNTNGLIAARTQDSSRFFTLPNGIGQDSGFLTDLAGDNPQAYGDGAGDGFNDKFLTPEAVGIQVCKIVAYKSVAKGGPARGSETLANANFVSFDVYALLGALSFMMPNVGPCGAFFPTGITQINSANPIPIPIREIPENERGDYDRVGIVTRAFSYYFKPADVTENSYRYVDLILNNPKIDGIAPPPGTPGAAGVVWGTAERGDIVSPIFTKDCYASYMTTPSFIFQDLATTQEKSAPRMGCNFLEGFADAGSGSFINGIGPQEHFTRPNDFLNAPISGVASTDKTKKLKFKIPTSATSLNANDPYVLVVDLDTSKGASGSLLFNVSVDKVLFWDSTAGDNVFSPQTDAADRPNATSGSDNLTNTARRNLIFHLPTILSQTK